MLIDKVMKMKYHQLSMLLLIKRTPPNKQHKQQKENEINMTAPAILQSLIWIDELLEIYDKMTRNVVHLCYLEEVGMP